MAVRAKAVVDLLGELAGWTQDEGADSPIDAVLRGPRRSTAGEWAAQTRRLAGARLGTTEHVSAGEDGEQRWTGWEWRAVACGAQGTQERLTEPQIFKTHSNLLRKTPGYGCVGRALRLAEPSEPGCAPMAVYPRDATLIVGPQRSRVKQAQRAAPRCARPEYSRAALS